MCLCSTIHRVVTTSNWRSTSSVFLYILPCIVIIPAKTVHQRAYGVCDFQLSILNTDDSRISVARLINYAHYTFSCKMSGHANTHLDNLSSGWTCVCVHEQRGHREVYTLTKCNYRTKQPTSGKARHITPEPCV